MTLFWRLALLAWSACLVAYAPGAAAQIPGFSPPPKRESEPEPEPESPPAPDPEPLPAAPAPPPGPASPPVAPPIRPAHPSAPLPAKADHIADQSAAEAERALDEAEEEDPDYDEDGKPRRRWYGWQTLIADGASLALLLTAASMDGQGSGDESEALVTMALIGYEFAPGIMHFAHKNPGRGFASFGIRLGMPLAGAFLGAAAASGCDGFLCEAGGAGVGVLLGIGGAIAIDAAVFAYEDRRSSRRDGRLVPLLVVAPHQAWIGLGGQL